MKHLGIVIPGLHSVGGAEREALLLAQGLRRRGWRVTVVVLSGDGGSAAGELRRGGIEFCSLGFRKGLVDPRGWRRFRQWLRRERPDVLHAHLPHAAWLARTARLWFPVPALLDTVHSTATGGWGRRLLYRLSRSLPDTVTAVSQAAAESHLRAGMISAQSLRILPNGVDFDRFAPDQAARQALRGDLNAANAFVWLAAGRLEAVKDYPTLLRALAELPSHHWLLIAGSGPQEAELKALSAHLGLGRRVRFLGFCPDLERSMQAADGFVLSSRWEGLPLVLLEAAGCELPIVATDVPGTREVLEALGIGHLVPPSDPAALAGAMRELAQEPADELRPALIRARQNAVARFAIERVLDRWEVIYDRLMGLTAAPGSSDFETGERSHPEEPSLGGLVR